jgi:uncharacterized protein YaeQ
MTRWSGALGCARDSVQDAQVRFPESALNAIPHTYPRFLSSSTGQEASVSADSIEIAGVATATRKFCAGYVESCDSSLSSAMALTATIHHYEISLSDVDRGVYESLDLRIAQHPSETMTRLLTRTLAYCLAYEEGIGFSKGGLSSVDEAPIAIHDRTGQLLRWIDIGAPSAERLHKASKAVAANVSIYTHELAQLRRQVEGQTIHKADAIEVIALDQAFMDSLASHVDRRSRFELTRTDGALYVAIAGKTLETTITKTTLDQLIAKP